MSETTRRRTRTQSIDSAASVLRGLLSSSGDAPPTPKAQKRNLEDLLELILDISSGEAHLNVEAAFRSAKENHQLANGGAPG